MDVLINKEPYICVFIHYTVLRRCQTAVNRKELKTKTDEFKAWNVTDS